MFYHKNSIPYLYQLDTSVEPKKKTTLSLEVQYVFERP